MARPTAGAVRFGCLRHGDCERVHRLWRTGSRGSAGQRGVGWWRGRAVFVAEFVLVHYGGYCRTLRRIRVGIHEYGRADWWSCDGLAHSLDRVTIWLERCVSYGVSLVSAGW